MYAIRSYYAHAVDAHRAVEERTLGDDQVVPAPADQQHPGAVDERGAVDVQVVV